MAGAGARIGALLSASSLVLSACATPTAGANGLYASPIGTAPVTANPTPYTDALVCIAQYARQYNLRAPRISIARISDFTGKEEADGSGRKITQGASLMAMTAFAKAGIPLVERFDTSVSELELKYANNKLISDGPTPGVDGPVDPRKIFSGQVAGSDFYVTGGITELNFNIRSSGADIMAGDRDAEGAKGSFRARVFVMNIAMDLRLVNTRTLEVVDVISYQKQIVGREVGLGLFDFLNGNVFDVSGGTGALEPVQLAVRALVERATVEMAANLYGMPGPQSCMSVDPLGGGTTGPTGGFTPAYNNLEPTMPRPVRSLIAGTMAAAPVIALLCAAGTSQAQTPPSEVVSNQIFLGDAFSPQVLNVVSVTEGVGAETAATGNNLIVSGDGVDLNVTANQTMAGSTIASTTATVTAEMGASSQINTIAIGNAIEAGATQGTMVGVYTQIATAAPEVTAIGMLEADVAEAGDIGLATTATANSVSLGLTNGSAGVLVNQTSAASVLADGGAVVGYVSGTVDVSGVAAGNVMSLVGTDSSAARAITFQSNTAALTQASQFTAYGNAQTASTSATASGNVAVSTNEGVLLDLTATQFNQSYVRAQAEGTAYQFGEGAATAYAVGNSTLAGNSGEAVVLENVQVNTGGGVEAIASFGGTDGYDGYARATAVGNDTTGYACTTCYGSMTIDSRQTNSADVGATATTTIGSGRVINSTSTAVGNNASFYVTRPGS